MVLSDNMLTADNISAKNILSAQKILSDNECVNEFLGKKIQQHVIIIT
jgi:hypothetical protein